MLNFYNAIKLNFSPRLVNHLAGRLGEREQGVSLALNAAISVVLLGLIRSARAGGAPPLQQFIPAPNPSASGGHLTLTGMLAMLGAGSAAGSALGRGEALLTTLFGSGTALVSAISHSARIKLESARALLQLVAAVLPGLVGQLAARRGLRARGLAVMLASQNIPIRAAMPAELRELTKWVGRGGPETPAPLGAEPWGAAPARWPWAAGLAGARWYRVGAVFASLILLAYGVLNRLGHEVAPASWSGAAQLTGAPAVGEG